MNRRLAYETTERKADLSTGRLSFYLFFRKMFDESFVIFRLDVSCGYRLFIQAHIIYIADEIVASTGIVCDSERLASRSKAKRQSARREGIIQLAVQVEFEFIRAIERTNDIMPHEWRRIRRSANILTDVI